MVTHCSTRPTDIVRDVVYALRNLVSRSISLPSTSQMTLNFAAWSGNLDAVKETIKETSRHRLPQGAVTPLHLSAANGHFQIAQYLLEDKESVNWLDRFFRRQVGRSDRLDPLEFCRRI